MCDFSRDSWDTLQQFCAKYPRPRDHRNIAAKTSHLLVRALLSHHNLAHYLVDFGQGYIEFQHKQLGFAAAISRVNITFSRQQIF